MRSLSGPRNRVILVVAGMLTLAAAAWLVAVAFSLVDPAGSAGALVPSEAATVADLVDQHRAWLHPASAAVAVLAVLAGLALLIAQIPKAPAHTTLRLQEGDGAVLATMQPQVLERALAERAETVPGIVDADLRVSGSATAPQLVGDVSVSDRAEVEWAVPEARRLLASDVEAALGVVPRSVDLLVRLRATRSPRTDRDRVAVTPRSEGGALLSEAS